MTQSYGSKVTVKKCNHDSQTTEERPFAGMICKLIIPASVLSSEVLLLDFRK